MMMVNQAWELLQSVLDAHNSALESLTLTSSVSYPLIHYIHGLYALMEAGHVKDVTKMYEATAVRRFHDQVIKVVTRQEPYPGKT